MAADESKDDDAATIPDIAIEDDVLEQDDASTPHEALQSDPSIIPTSRPDIPQKPQSAVPNFTEQAEDAAALREAYEELSKTHREEITANLERIDALQAKLEYLASQAATSARSAADDSEAGSVDRKLAEKDEQIALLMEEGQALSKKELNYLNTIKKLRAKVGEDEKAIADLRRRLAKAEGSVSDVADRAKRAEAQAKATESKVKQLEKAEKEKRSLKAERDEPTRKAENWKMSLIVQVNGRGRWSTSLASKRPQWRIFRPKSSKPTRNSRHLMRNLSSARRSGTLSCSKGSMKKDQSCATRCRLRYNRQSARKRPYRISWARRHHRHRVGLSVGNSHHLQEMGVFTVAATSAEMYHRSSSFLWSTNPQEAAGARPILPNAHRVSPPRFAESLRRQWLVSTAPRMSQVLLRSTQLSPKKTLSAHHLRTVQLPT
ncbi:TATA element modulatory factor 1 DNA binding-domain-containing protein [Phyllosticta paracitricarpa]|uniref:TATA element modulatory factor 1 DNA binding-domain-containing protein n=1 Tax=Phyllosticta paracitricarpa TaxID=2016321 RepID=A0ABR1MU85_9PEZI